MSDSSSCWTMRVTVLVFSACVLAYAIAMQGTPIYDTGLGRLPGDAGRRLRAAGVRPVLEARHHAGRDRSRSCWASAPGCCSCAHAGWARPSRRSWPACWRPSSAWCVGSLAPQVRDEPPRARTTGRWRLTRLSRRPLRGAAALEGRRAAYNCGFCITALSHADLRLPLRVLRPCQGRAAEDLRRAADRVPGLRRRARSASRSPPPASSSRARAGTSPTSAAATAARRPTSRADGDAAAPSADKADAKRRRRQAPTPAARAAPRRRQRPPPAPAAARRLPPATATERHRHGTRVKKYLLAGLLVWLPLAITIWVLQWVLGTAGRRCSLAADALSQAVLPEATRERSSCCAACPGLGVLVLVVRLLLTGVFVANIVGQWWLRQWRPAAAPDPDRQVDLQLGQAGVGHAVLRAAATPFARRCWCSTRAQGSWTIAFVTGTPGGEVAQPPARRLPQRLRADHAQPDLGLLPDDAAQRRASSCA